MTEVVEMLVCPQKGPDYKLEKVLIESEPREDGYWFAWSQRVFAALISRLVM
jgi:hypothetical protein